MRSFFVPPQMEAEFIAAAADAYAQVPWAGLLRLPRIFVHNLTRPVPKPRNQDRRKNRRIVARRRLREARSGTEPDDSIYMIDEALMRDPRRLREGEA